MPGRGRCPGAGGAWPLRPLATGRLPTAAAPPPPPKQIWCGYFARSRAEKPAPGCASFHRRVSGPAPLPLLLPGQREGRPPDRRPAPHLPRAGPAAYRGGERRPPAGSARAGTGRCCPRSRPPAPGAPRRPSPRPPYRSQGHPLLAGDAVARWRFPQRHGRITGYREPASRFPTPAPAATSAPRDARGRPPPALEGPAAALGPRQTDRQPPGPARPGPRHTDSQTDSHPAWPGPVFPRYSQAGSTAPATRSGPAPGPAPRAAVLAAAAAPGAQSGARRRPSAG